MQPARVILVAFLSLAMPASAALAQPASETKETGEVEVLVLAPDGHPVANADIQIGQANNFPGQESPVQTVHTDGAGRAVVNWPTGTQGNQTMRVSVKGVGYGSTGLLEVIPGRKSKAFLPPLAPWATIRGQVPRALLTPETTVGFVSRFGPETGAVKPDAEGRFEAEVEAGTRWVSISSGGKRTGYVPGAMTVLPGETLTVPAMEPVPEETPKEKQEQEAYQKSTYRERHPAMTWVTGTVRDTAGKPLAGIDVCAFATYSGVIRMYEMVETAKTDDAGRYTISGEGNLEAFSAALVAYGPGRCPAWSWLPARKDWEEPPWKMPKPAEEQAPAPTVDLVLGDQGGTLEVEVVVKGLPVAGAAVSLELEGVRLRDIWARESRSPARAAVEAAVSPKGTTDASGLVRFEHLIPGLYHISASPGGKQAGGFGPTDQAGHISGDAVGVAARQGVVTRECLALGRQAGGVRVEVRQTNGLSLTGTGLRFGWSQVGSGSGWNTSVNLDSSGGVVFAPGGSGLWRVSYQFHDVPARWWGSNDPPYFEAAGIVATSPRLSQVAPVPLTARAVVSGKVTVKLVDAQDRPVRGVVELGSLPGQAALAGSTDAEGRVRFEGVRAWNYHVYGYAEGMGPIMYGEDDSPLPDDSVLKRGWAFLPQEAAVGPNSDVTVVLKARAVGYVRGVLKPAAGKKTSDYELWVEPESGAGAHYQRQTGRFVAGPFEAGKAILRIAGGGLGLAELGRREVMVEAGRVTEVEISAPEAGAGAMAGQGSQTTMMSMGAGLQTLGRGGEAIRGSVRMADGKTAAFGAQVYFFAPGGKQPSGMGLVDAVGTIQAHGSWMWGGGGTEGAAKRPLVAVMLPGTCGVVTVTPTAGQALGLVLPAPRQLKGRVTVGAAAPAGAAEEIRIVAAREEEGRASGLMGVQTTADADGRYVLAGLTPGKYRIQAALDNLWLSRTENVEVGEKDLADLNFEIGAPGEATTLTLTGSDRKPLVGQAITVDRPDGPLARLCWPAEWISDGAGRVFIPTLEVGEHVYHVKSDGSEHKVNVSPLKVSLQPEVSGRVVDEDTSAPVSGGLISANLRSDKQSFPASATVTSPSGIWSLPIPGTGEMELQVQAAGYLPLQLKVPVVEGKSASDVLIKLTHGSTLRGTVFEADDVTPMVKAGISLSGPSIYERPVVTDSKGEFSFNALPPGKFVVTVTASGYIAQKWTVDVPAHKDPPAQRLTMASRGGTIRGTVTSGETGKPLAGKMVALVMSRDYGFKFQSVFVSLQATSDDDPDDLLIGVGLHDAPHGKTDAQGRFEIRNIPFGNWVATALEKNLPPQPSEELVLDKGQTVENLKLKLSRKPAGYLLVRVILPDGTGPEDRTGVAFQVKSVIGTQTDNNNGVILTASGGRSYMPVWAGRHCTFTLALPGYNIIRDELDAAADQGSEKEYRFTTVKAGSEIRGRVLKPDDEPAAGAFIVPFVQEAMWPGFNHDIGNAQTSWQVGDDFTAVTASDGTFTITKLSAGRYGLFAFPADPRHMQANPGNPRQLQTPAPRALAQCRPVMLEPFEVAENAQVKDVTISLAPGSTLVVEAVSAATGYPVVGMDIWLTPNRMEGVAMPLERMLPNAARSDAKGQARFEGLPAGQYGICCCQTNEFTGPLIQPYQGPVLKAGETVEFKVQCTPKPGVQEKKNP